MIFPSTFHTVLCLLSNEGTVDHKDNEYNPKANFSLYSEFKAQYMTETFVFSENADSSTINSLVFLRHAEVITVNSSGQLKTFDLRSSSDAPAQTLSV